MELKKTQAASLENKRATHFLLGLVCALSLLIAALEYTSREERLDDHALLADDLTQELEAVPAVAPKEMAPQTVDEQKIVPAEKVTIVDEPLLEHEATAPETSDIVTVGGEKEVSREELITAPIVPQPLDLSGEPLPLRVLERLPEFPGGMSAFVQWLTKHLTYPTSARGQRLEGRVVASFIVNSDGTVSNLKIVKSVLPVFDREVLRVLQTMPNWKPGEYKGVPCRTVVNIPVTFKI